MEPARVLQEGNVEAGAESPPQNSWQEKTLANLLPGALQLARLAQGFQKETRTSQGAEQPAHRPHRPLSKACWNACIWIHRASLLSVSRGGEDDRQHFFFLTREGHPQVQSIQIQIILVPKPGSLRAVLRQKVLSTAEAAGERALGWDTNECMQDARPHAFQVTFLCSVSFALHGDSRR